MTEIEGGGMLDIEEMLLALLPAVLAVEVIVLILWKYFSMMPEFEIFVPPIMGIILVSYMIIYNERYKHQVKKQ